MKLLTEHDDANNRYSVHLTFENHTMFVLLMIHALPIICANELNHIPTFELSAYPSWYSWRNMYLTLIYELPIDPVWQPFNVFIYSWYILLWDLLILDWMALHKPPWIAVSDLWSLIIYLIQLCFDNSRSPKSVAIEDVRDWPYHQRNITHAARGDSVRAWRQPDWRRRTFDT